MTGDTRTLELLSFSAASDEYDARHATPSRVAGFCPLIVTMMSPPGSDLSHSDDVQMTARHIPLNWFYKLTKYDMRVTCDNEHDIMTSGTVSSKDI